MLCREIIAVCSEIHTKHINTQCGQNVELSNVRPGGTYSYHLFINLAVIPAAVNIHSEMKLGGNSVAVNWTR
jgi:hypothetical protein